MEAEKIWEKILSLIKKQISPGNYQTWFRQTKLASLKEGKLSLAVPSAFIKGQLAARYQDLINEAAKTILGAAPQIEFVIDSKLLAKTRPQEDEPFSFGSTSAIIPISPLNPKYTLENFVVGLTNNLAYAAAQAVVQNPGVSYNPLFIYGPSGVGKTHLMQAIGNALLTKNPSTKIVYAPSERFMVDFVDSIRTKTTQEFRSKYRSCQLLLIDDIQFISGKDSTQEEFFHSYNELHAKNVQLVFTSDRPPHEIQKLESRLQSRFQGGLMVDIQPPDFDTRVAILKAKLHERGEELPEEILKLIAETVVSNTRELEGKLIQVLQFSKLGSLTLDLESIKKFLGKTTAIPSIAYDSRKVLTVVHQYFNVKMPDLTGPRRQKELVLPRQIAMYILYVDCRVTMERIGEMLGGRDHTTILYGIEKIKGLLPLDKEIQRLITEVKQSLSS